MIAPEESETREPQKSKTATTPSEIPQVPSPSWPQYLKAPGNHDCNPHPRMGNHDVQATPEYHYQEGAHRGPTAPMATPAQLAQEPPCEPPATSLTRHTEMHRRPRHDQ